MRKCRRSQTRQSLTYRFRELVLTSIPMFSGCWQQVFSLPSPPTRNWDACVMRPGMGLGQGKDAGAEVEGERFTVPQRQRTAVVPIAQQRIRRRRGSVVVQDGIAESDPVPGACRPDDVSARERI